MANETIPDLTAGTPPYDETTLVEVAVPDGLGGYVSRKAQIPDLIPDRIIASRLTSPSSDAGGGGLLLKSGAPSFSGNQDGQDILNIATAGLPSNATESNVAGIGGGIGLNAGTGGNAFDGNAGFGGHINISAGDAGNVFSGVGNGANGGSVNITLGERGVGSGGGTDGANGNFNVNGTHIVNYDGHFATFNHVAPEIDSTAVFYTPATGDTITMGAAQQRAIAVPAAGIAALTVVLPSTPTDNQIAGVTSTKAVTTLTVSAPGGASVVAAPATLAAGGSFRMIYHDATTTWYPAS